MIDKHIKIRSRLNKLVLITLLLIVHACSPSTSTKVTESSSNLDLGTEESESGVEFMAGEDSQTDAEVMLEPWIQIGTGFRRYETLEPRQEVPIIAGIQGGFHVWGAFIGEGFDDIDVRVIYTMLLNGEVLAQADYTEFELPENSRGQFEYAGVSVIYHSNDDVEPTSGQEFLLKLRVESRDGQSFEDEIQIRPQCCE